MHLSIGKSKIFQIFIESGSHLVIILKADKKAKEKHYDKAYDYLEN